MNKGVKKGRGCCYAPALPLLDREALPSLFLGRALDVLDHSPQLFPELLVAVIDAVQVSARTRHALNDPAGLFDVLIAHLVQRKLRRVEGHSVRTMDSRSRPECDQGLIACRKRGVASHPIERVGVLLQYGFWHLAQEVGNETEVLLEVVEDLLPSHDSPPFPRDIPTTNYSSKDHKVAIGD